MKTTKIEVPINAEIIINGKWYNKHKEYYKELPHHIQFFNGELKITQYTRLKYNFDEKKYNIVLHTEDIMEKNKVMIPCNSSDIKEGDWYIGKYENSEQHLAWLKLERKSAIGYKPNCFELFRFLINIPNEQPEYKIIDRSEAEELGYTLYENNTNINLYE